jgi:hypothetical protein
VAAVIKKATGLDAEITPGGRGEFSVWVDGAKVVEKTRTGFPSEDAALAAVTAAL